MATEFLKKQGYRLVERNYSVPEGEIDIIAQKSGELTFVEVKTRRSKKYGEAIEAVTDEKADRFFTAVEKYLAEKNIGEETAIRFDIITVDLSGGHPHIEHFKDAFS